VLSIVLRAVTGIGSIRLLVSEKGFGGPPGTRGVESAAGVVNGQQVVVDPLVVFGGFLVGHCCR
jgi:hypothetical protein